MDYMKCYPKFFRRNEHKDNLQLINKVQSQDI
jgi:hypothetical protein